MKKLFLLLLTMAFVHSSFAQTAIETINKQVVRAAQIKKFDETAVKNAAAYAANKPTPTYSIPDDFKVKYKYCKAWVEGDVMTLATDAKVTDVTWKITTKAALWAHVYHFYGSDKPVFSDKMLLSDLQSKMPVGSAGYAQAEFHTIDGYFVTIIFDVNYTFKSANLPATADPKLLSVDISVFTGDHDKEADKKIYVYCSKTQNKSPSGSEDDPSVRNSRIIEYLMQDPAKWDDGDVKNISITVQKNVHLSDFNNGGYFTMRSEWGDRWSYSATIVFKFDDNTKRVIRFKGYAGVNFTGFNFDKDFKVVKKWVPTDNY